MNALTYFWRRGYGRTLIGTLFVLAYLFPVYWMVATSLKTRGAIFATPPQVATKELLPYLPYGHEVVLAGFAHVETFWSEQPEAGSRLINTFLGSGRVDDSLYQPMSIQFTPEVTQTGYAKRIAAAMVGLALLAVLSLMWMARRALQQAAFGGKTSALLRTLHPLVLGVGGWFLGELVVMTAIPGVPLDDEPLVVLSMSLPIGLGIYFAGIRRGASVSTRIVGFAAAIGGALVGGWLGFNATAGFVAIATTLVGAALGANLSVILLDIARDRSVHDRFVETNAKTTLNARSEISAKGAWS